MTVPGVAELTLLHELVSNELNVIAPFSIAFGVIIWCRKVALLVRELEMLGKYLLDLAPAN